MTPANNKILVKCNLAQKDFIHIGGSFLKTSNAYQTNYRERSPVIAVAMESKGEIGFEDVILAHHNLFYAPSPFYLKDDLFSIPFSTSTIFAVIDKEGSPKAVCGNIIAEEIEVETAVPLPPDMRTKYKDRVRVLSDGCGYKKGQLIFTRPSAPYIIVYVFNGIEKRVVKVNSEMIMGKLV